MPKGTSPVTGEKPKPKRRRAKKAKPQVDVIPASAPALARFVSIERQVPAKRKKSSWFFSALQIVFAVIVIVGAYALFHQVRNVQEEAKKREAVLEEQLRNQVGAVQDKFDKLIQTWEQAKADQSAGVPVEYSLQGTPISGTHSSRLGTIVHGAGEVGFSANPDVLGFFSDTNDTCKEPLAVNQQGYCDVIDLDGTTLVERVAVELDSEGTVSRVIKSVTIPIDDKKFFVWSVDLGSPVIEGRDVFAPVDEDAQKQAVTEYVRTILKHEDLPEVLAENLNAFDDLIEHLRLQP